MPDVSQYNYKSSAYIDFKFFRGQPGSDKAVNITANLDNLKEIVDDVIAESELFSTYSFDQSKLESGAKHVKIHLYNHGNFVLAALSGAISGVSMGVIPAYAKDKYTLICELEDAEKPFSHQNDDAVSTWMGWIFLPFAGNTPKKALRSTLENQLKDALQKLVESGQLEYSNKQQPAAINRFLVGTGRLTHCAA